MVPRHTRRAFPVRLSEYFASFEPALITGMLGLCWGNHPRIYSKNGELSPNHWGRYAMAVLKSLAGGLGRVKGPESPAADDIAPSCQIRAVLVIR